MSSNLKALCKLSGIKQVVLAKEIGVAQGVVSDWQNDKYFPSAENLIKLSKILNVRVDCILGLEPIPEGYPDHLQPVIYYNEAIEPEQPKAAETKRTFQPKKAPFTQEQLSYLGDMLDEREERLTNRIVEALREDTFLLREQESKQAH